MNRTAKIPERLWKLDPSQLMPGDVLLEQGHHWVNVLIRTFDRGDFSHALIWCGPTDFFEAVDGGTRAITFARFFIEKPEDWTLLRLVDDPAAAARAAFEVRNLAHVPYSKEGAIKTKLPFAKLVEEGQFCSQLVALCYQKAGIELVAGTEPHKVTPAKLQKASRLSEVPMPLLEITDEGTRQWATAYLNRDAAYAQSGPARDLKISQAIMAEIEGLIPLLKTKESAGFNYPPRNIVETLTLLQVVPEALANRVADGLLDAIRRHEYAAVLDNDLPEVRQSITMQFNLLRDTNLPADERLALETEFRIIATAWTSERDRHWHLFDTYDQTNGVRPHELWRELAAMHRRYADEFHDLVELAKAEPLTKLA